MKDIAPREERIILEGVSSSTHAHRGEIVRVVRAENSNWKSYVKLKLAIRHIDKEDSSRGGRNRDSSFFFFFWGGGGGLGSLCSGS